MLITLAQAQSELAQSLPADTSALSACVAAACSQVVRYCKRDFELLSYDELYSGRGYSSLLLRQYPVSSIARLATSSTTVLSVTNLDPVTNQRATAQLATSGDVAGGLTVTGLSLGAWASGANLANTIAFTANQTIQAVADAVNALGGGWSATATQGYALWPASDLRPVQGAQGCLGSARAEFQAFVNDLSTYSLNDLTGEVRLDNQSWDPVFALMNVGQSSLLSSFPPGFNNIRVQYTAGYATVPGDVQQAALMTTKAMLMELQTQTQFASEAVKGYSYHLAEADERGIPKVARRLLQPWRSFRSSF